MKRFTIVSVNKTAAGNYSGYSSMGERVHIYGKQYENAGSPTGTFYVTAEPVEYDETDDKDQPTGVKFVRLTARGVFANAAAYADAATADMALDIAVLAARKKIGLANKLDDAELSRLLAQSI